MTPLTPRQEQILEWFESYTRREGLPPTLREIGSAFDITVRAVFNHLIALERKGRLRRRTSGHQAHIWVLPRT